MGKVFYIWDLKDGFVSGGFSLLLFWVLKLFAQATKATKTETNNKHWNIHVHVFAEASFILDKDDGYTRC